MNSVFVMDSCRLTTQIAARVFVDLLNADEGQWYPMVVQAQPGETFRHYLRRVWNVGPCTEQWQDFLKVVVGVGSRRYNSSVVLDPWAPHGRQRTDVFQGLDLSINRTANEDPEGRGRFPNLLILTGMYPMWDKAK